MASGRLSRRNFLAGASAALALPGVAVAAVKKGTKLRLWILKTYVEPTNKAIEASAARWGEKHGASVTVEYFTFEDVQTKYVAAIDVAVHPDSAEGRWLMQDLRQSGIPVIGAAPWSSFCPG